MSSLRRFVGLDLGGTNIKSAVIEIVPGSIPVVLYNGSEPTEADQGPDAVAERIVEIGAALTEKFDQIDAVGVTVPGMFNERTGRVAKLPNLPGDWVGMPLRGKVAAGIGLPTAMINDAKAFTLAESTVGAAKGATDVLAVVLGTGIGGGLMVNGKLIFGHNGQAGEIGHQVVIPDGPLCGCGGRGCLESIAATGPLLRRTGKATVKEVFDAARAGEPAAVEAVNDAITYIGLAIANIITMLLPSRVVVGGGIANAGDQLFVPLREQVARFANIVNRSWYEVVPAALGSDGGAIGAALWADLSPTKESAPRDSARP